MTTQDAPPPPKTDWAYFLDLDGTLLELAPSPSTVRLVPRTHALVRALHRRSGGALALVTGRSIADVDRIFGDPPLPVAGQHGLERRGAPGTFTPPRSDAEVMSGTRERLGALVARHAGLLLEDKGLSLALHYRQRPSLATVVHDVMHAERFVLGDGYRVQRGKKVVELRPTASDKGDAIEAFLAGAPFEGRTPVFIGDDETDEDGFSRVNALGGYSIRVGPGSTLAGWRLDDPAAVVAWLERAIAP